MQWNSKVFNWECNCGSIIHWQFSSRICATATFYQQINCERKVFIVSMKSKPVGRKKVQMNSNSIALFSSGKNWKCIVKHKKSWTIREKMKNSVYWMNQDKKSSLSIKFGQFQESIIFHARLIWFDTHVRFRAEWMAWKMLHDELLPFCMKHDYWEYFFYWNSLYLFIFIINRWIDEWMA